MTTSTNSRVIPLTDDRGRPLLPESDQYEPLPGSIVLLDGRHGTAWQRHFSDGLWHCAGRAAPKTWEQIITKRNVVLVYDAEPRGRRI